MNGEFIYNEYFERNGINVEKLFYENNRYLEKYPENKLIERMSKLFDNIAVFDWNGNFHFSLKNIGRIEKEFINTFYEFQLRNLDIEEIRENKIKSYNKNIVKFDIDKLNRINEKIKGKQILVKYLKEKYLEKWQNDYIHFSLSTYFNNEYLLDSIRDDENSMEYDNIPGLTIEGVYSGPKLPVFKLTHTVPPYYISSFSNKLDPKLFFLFGKDSCFIIKNVEEYIVQTLNYFLYNQPTTKVIFDKINYIDNAREVDPNNEVEFKKSYIYQYENELRFVLYLKNNEYSENSLDFKVDGMFTAFESISSI
jgi:hypothetical protein